METHNIFTDDLMEDILLRLPVRHLLRFRCVSKSWCALIDSTSIINKHHHIQSAISREEGDAPLFSYSQLLYHDIGPSQFYLLSKKQGDGILCLTPDLDRDRVPNDDPNHFLGLRCLGLVNGVVGLYWGCDVLSFGLWNPATRDFIVVPPPRPNDFKEQMEFGVDILGLGFDPKSSDFKMVRSMCWSEEDYSCEMYSLSTNSWTSLELAVFPGIGLKVNFPRTDGYYNGVYYWTAAEVDLDDFPQRYVILSFDFSTEAFKSFDAPPVIVAAANDFDDNYDWKVGHYMERLAVIFDRLNSGEELNSFEIWVASEFDVGRDSGIPLSWQHLFTIKPQNGVYAWACVAFRMDGDVLLEVYTDIKKKKCKLYNPSTRTFKKLELLFDCGYRYVESLFPLTKWQIQSYQELNKLKKRKREQVLEKFVNEYDEKEDSESPSETKDNAYSRPTSSHRHKCSCCNELGSIKKQLNEMRKVVVSMAGMLTDNLNPPSQPRPPPLSLE